MNVFDSRLDLTINEVRTALFHGGALRSDDDKVCVSGADVFFREMGCPGWNEGMLFYDVKTYGWYISVPSGSGSVLLPMTRVAEWRTDCPREEENDDEV